jgi:DinB family protein
MKHRLEWSIGLLERTPGALDALLRGLPADWILGNEGGNTWNAREVVAHLVHGERTDWIPRAHMVLECGENETFVPFDQSGQVHQSEGKSPVDLLDEFARLRAENLWELRGMNLQEEDLERRGRHPALGVVTLSELLATWAVHDLTHLHQISRILAHPYREAVGPWSAYLGVLRCGGQGA